MKKVNFVGKIIIAVGILHLFTTVQEFNGFGGYFDNAWTILVVSLMLVGTGSAIVLISRKSL
ncbi:hypothetical protein [uncultured Cytophaga sp.]|uniref:hypothetical protein n=1 Tax=uncultured Cytophaga sp. TaxID=160238 RepID=UPI00263698C8|nr:hypothetical protein [uncultured Cytophaga sp.]